MIKIVESIKCPQEKAHPAYLGRPIYDINRDIFKFPSKRPKYKFYPKRTLPMQGNDSLMTCEAKNNVYIGSYNNLTFKYVDEEIIKFKINTRAHTVKFIDKQVFMASDSHLYSYHDHKYQSLQISSICMDTNELTNEVVLLQKDRIKFLGGTEYGLDCQSPRGIVFTEHPRNVILTTTNSIYHVDLRTKKPNLLINTDSYISSVIKTENNYIFQTRVGFTVLDKYFKHNEYTSMYLSPLFKLTANDTKIIGYSNTVFKYFDINNLSINSTIKHDIHDFIGFATQNNRHYFFRDNCIDEFDNTTKIRSMGCRFKDDILKKRDTSFFDYDYHDNRRCAEYDIINNLDVDKYDEFIKLVELEDAGEDKNKKAVQKKRIKRSAGF